MKYFRLAILFFYLISSSEAKADICAYISENTAQKAVAALKGNTSIIEFCSNCINETPRRLSIQTIDSKNVPNSDFKQLYLNGKPCDLAHIFIYMPKTKQYENLALTAECSEAEKNKNLLLASFKDIKDLKATANPCPKDDFQCLKDLAQQRYMHVQELCHKQTEIFGETTFEMQKSAYDYVSCLTDEFKKELNEIFDEQYVQQAEKYLEQIVKNSNLFFGTLYSDNKFCLPHCGTMAGLYPPMETENILQQLYETTVILKFKKGH